MARIRELVREHACVKRSRSDAMPSQVVCVGVDLQRTGVWNELDGRKRSTVYWQYAKEICITRWRWEQGEAVREVVDYPQSQAEFWQAIIASCRSGVVTWVFCWRAQETMAALGFWELLDRDILIIEDEPGPGSGGDVEVPKRDWRGFLITDGPPWACYARFPGHPGSVKIVSLENYAFEPPAREVGAGLECIAAVNAVRQYRRLLTENGLGEWRLTVASQALFAYRRKFLDSPIELHGYPEALKLEEAAMYGGRTEAYRIGPVAGMVHHLDVNAMYSACALDNPFPAQFALWTDDISLEQLTLLVQRWLAIARVVIQTNEPVYPYRHEGLTIWPVGEFETTLAGPELVHAMAFGRVKAVREASLYAGAPIFREWVKTLWTLRKRTETERNGPLLRVVKALMVGLYGRFGMKGRRLVYHPEIPNEYRWESWLMGSGPDGEIENWRCLAGRVYQQVKGDWDKHAAPAVAAWVTSLGRMTLHNYMELAGREDVYYVDTDSLWTTTRGYQRLLETGKVNPDSLGSLKEVQRVADFRVYGWKHYSAGGKLTCAGLPKGTDQLSVLRPEWPEPEPLATALAGKRQPEAKMVIRSAARREPYKHGRVMPDGSVKPHTV